MPLEAELQRLGTHLTGVDRDAQGLVRRLCELIGEDDVAFWRLLNSHSVWGGAGSLASATLAANPGLPDPEWRARVRDIREILMGIGRMLMARGPANPGISSWILAFSNWNDSGV